MPINGEPTIFSTGAKRDKQEGKGRLDLLPLYEVADLIEDIDGENSITDILRYIETFQRGGSLPLIHYAIVEFVKIAYGDLETALIEVGHRYEEGGIAYGDRNWEKGVPLHVYVSSAIRHLLKWKRRDNDEDHAGAFMWNMLNLIYTFKNIPEVNDLPRSSDDNE